MATISWGIVIDITDNTTDTNADIGLYSGVFYWITGRPGYAGSGYSGEAPASKTWKQGVIAGSLKPMIRMTEGLEDTGGYGGLSGFTFSANDSSASGSEASSLNNILEANDYFLINRSIDVYCFLDNISYHVWGGVVSGKKKEKGILNISCEDDFRTVHKQIPPQIINEATFPNLNNKYDGIPLPICLGSVNKAKMMAVVSNVDPIVMGNLNGNDLKMAPCWDQDEATKKIQILTWGKTYVADELKNFYIRSAIGNDESFLIISNDASAVASGLPGYYTTDIYLGLWFGETVVAYNDIDNVTLFGSDLWYFEITKFNLVHIVSNDEIESFKSSDDGMDVDVSYWGDVEKDYINISENKEQSSSTSIETTGYPGLTMTAKPLNIEGEVKKVTGLAFKSVVSSITRDTYLDYTVSGGHAFNAPTAPLPSVNLNDRNSSTSYTTKFGQTQSPLQLYLQFDVELPDRLKESDFDKVFVVPDLLVESGSTSPFDSDLTITFSVAGIDFFSRVTELVLPQTSILVNNEKVNSSSPLDVSMVPKEYYNLSADDSYFYEHSEFIDISSFIQNSRYQTAYPKLRFTIYFDISDVFSTLTITVKEMVLAIQKNINIINQDLYVKVKGESV